MYRRHLLRAAGIAFAGSLAGCQSSGDDDGDGGESTPADDDDTETSPTADEDTKTVGPDTGEQTVNRLKLADSVVGENLGGDDDIDVIRMVIKRVSGADNVALDEMTIQYVGPGGVDTLTASTDGTTATGYTISSVKDDDGSIANSDVLNDDTDVARIVFDPKEFNSSLSELSPGDSATLTITTQTGGETEVRLSVPDTVQSRVVTLSP